MASYLLQIIWTRLYNNSHEVVQPKTGLSCIDLIREAALNKDNCLGCRSLECDPITIHKLSQILTPLCVLLIKHAVLHRVTLLLLQALLPCF